jgi:hypothetical protein
MRFAGEQVRATAEDNPRRLQNQVRDGRQDICFDTQYIVQLNQIAVRSIRDISSLISVIASLDCPVAARLSVRTA